jgi:hypothetical protein
MVRNLFGISVDVIFSRTAYAVVYGILTIVIFYELPDLLLKNFNGSLANLPLDNGSLFISYAILITILSSFQIIFQDHFIGDVAAVSNGVAQIFYIYIFANGGLITEYVSSAGVTLSLDFRTIIYLMMIPSALSIISAVISASSRSSVTPSETIEVPLN